MTTTKTGAATYTVCVVNFAQGPRYARELGGTFDTKLKTWTIPASDTADRYLSAAGAYGLRVLSHPDPTIERKVLEAVGDPNERMDRWAADRTGAVPLPTLTPDELAIWQDMITRSADGETLSTDELATFARLYPIYAVGGVHASVR